MSQLTVFCRGSEVTFTSPFSDMVALTKLWEMKPTSPFAKSLLFQSLNRDLSPKQMAWVHKIVLDFEEEVSSMVSIMVADIFKSVIHQYEKYEKTMREQQKREENQRLLDSLPTFDDMMNRLRSAAQVLKTPKIVFKLAHFEVRFNYYSENFVTVYAGSLKGSINPATSRLRMDNMTEEIRDVLLEIATDPVEFAKKYGLGTGVCCFCSRPLCDERTLAVGYGKKCASNWDLPWGVKRLKVKEIISSVSSDEEDTT